MHWFKGATVGFVLPDDACAIGPHVVSLYAVMVTAVAAQRRLIATVANTRFSMFEGALLKRRVAMCSRLKIASNPSAGGAAAAGPANELTALSKI